MFSIQQESSASPDAQELLAALWRELDELYGNEVPTQPSPVGEEAAGAALVVARANGDAIGCGALRPRGDLIAEVKRVYVRPAARRTGAARAIMATLEQLARDRGFNEIWLETGLRQPAALALYESLGYTRIAAFGDYMDDPLSVCYGRRLAN